MTTKADVRIAKSMTNIAIKHIISGEIVHAIDARLCGAVLLSNMINSMSENEFKLDLDKMGIGLFAYPITLNRVMIDIGPVFKDEE